MMDHIGWACSEHKDRWQDGSLVIAICGEIDKLLQSDKDTFNCPKCTEISEGSLYDVKCSFCDRLFRDDIKFGIGWGR